MTFQGPSDARLAIRERIDSYADAVFRRDAEDWIANWCEESVWSLPGLEVSGRGPIKAAWLQAMSAFPLAAFFANPGSIVVRGETAAARVYTQEVLLGGDGKLRRIIGAYDDELIQLEGVWLFRRRAYRILHDETSG